MPRPIAVLVYGFCLVVYGESAGFELSSNYVEIVRKGTTSIKLVPTFLSKIKLARI